MSVFISIKRLLCVILFCLSLVSWSQIKVDEYDTRITYKGENYIYSYRLGLILEQEDGTLKVIDSNTYGEPFIYGDQLILGSARDGYFKLTADKKLIPFDTGFLIEELRKFKIDGLKIVEGSTGCFGSSRYTTEFESFNGVLFEEKTASNFISPKTKVLKFDLSVALKNAADRIDGKKGDLDFYNFRFTETKAFKDKIIFLDSIVFFDDCEYEFLTKKVRHHESNLEYYNELIRIADSLVSYQPEKIKDLVDENNQLIVTIGSSHFYKIILKDSQHKEVTLFTSNNSTDINYSEWTVEIEGFKFDFQDISFSENINAIFNWNFFDKDISLDKGELLYRIVLAEYELLHSDKPTYED